MSILSTITVDVDYTAGSQPSLTFKVGGSGWSSSVPNGDTQPFKLQQSSVSPSNLTFYALTLWFDDDPTHEPSQTFQKEKTPASFGPQHDVTVSNIKVSASTIEFDVENASNLNEDLMMSVEIMIQDPSSNALYTSRDPQIRIEKPPG